MYNDFKLQINAVWLCSLIILFKALIPGGTYLNFMTCGTDSSVSTTEGTAPAHRFPWLGILYYTFDEDQNSERATTMCVLIHKEYALVPSIDVDNIPRELLRAKTRVLLGSDWSHITSSHHVISIYLHPHFKSRTLNTLALVKIDTFMLLDGPLTVCPPVARYKYDSALYNVIIEDVQTLAKTVRRMAIVNKTDCDEFFRKNKLSFRITRPIKPICAVALNEREACVWEGGSALVTRDAWGRWRLVGFGIHGPGCGTPSIYVDLYRNLRWIEDTIAGEDMIRVFRRAPNHLVLRQGSVGPENMQRTFKENVNLGDCYSSDISTDTLYREDSTFTCSGITPVKGSYKFQLTQMANLACISVSTRGSVKAKSPPFIWIEHYCDREAMHCHFYRNTTTYIEIAFIFTFKMKLKIAVTGAAFKNMNEPKCKLPEASDARNYTEIEINEGKHTASSMFGKQKN